ncbi:oxygenase MpaB family protein [Rhodococcoides yunnanense]|uniref:Oxygenase MpaB family protein n=1 Tax=Rhodococcoides yunnanense TaxID=278209 RepID=A0ABU4BE61_9NOCA|nr:oxygenase MpaB family protein [Rhodococcus yunnanensis]MDV6262470.1 oxygenase MpaB family protein [Rhodococcus yunnanensis]
MRSQSDRPVPLGPDSLTWKYFGDWRGMLQGVWAGSMQNMHPGLGAGVEQHSTFFDERWQRLYRSLYPIGGVVFDGDRAEETARQVRGYHTNIKGIDAKGRKYHALDPDTFYWAHATFFMGTVLTADHFMGGLTEEQKVQLFDEHVQWYRLYGMSMRPVPATWPEFQKYWKHMCTHVLEDNMAARGVLDLSKLGPPPYAAWLPDRVWVVLRRPVAALMVWITVGLYDESVRELLGFRWSARDDQRFALFGRAVNLAFGLVPPRRRLHPRGRAGWDRALGRTSATSPLVHTPARNLPPVARRSNPTHYSPKV